jgi:preprotein translocase subunit SecF
MVISCAFSDIIITLAIFNMTGIKLSMGGVAAFLMLIGYSIDTDILLTSRVFKRKEGLVMERIYSAIKTGLTMLNTTIIAVLVALIFVKSDVIRQIMLIIFIGLLVDMIMTWIQNVGLIRLYLEKKKLNLDHPNK